MSIVAVESQFMKTIMIHLVDKSDFILKATFHLTISMRGQLATGKIQRNNYHHGVASLL